MLPSFKSWQYIDTVLLDMDGTLLDLYFDNYFWMTYLPQKYGQKHGLSFDEASASIMPKVNQKKGTLAWYCLDFWTEELGMDIEALKTEVSDNIEIRPYVEDFLKMLGLAGKTVILLTNAHPKSLSLKMAHTGLSPYFDAVVSTHQYGLPKENPSFWSRFSADYSLDVSKTVLIDDTESVLLSAQDFGIRYLWTIAQPDSRLAVRTGLLFPSIANFNEVMPRV